MVVVVVVERERCSHSILLCCRSIIAWGVWRWGSAFLVFIRPGRHGCLSLSLYPLPIISFFSNRVSKTKGEERERERERDDKREGSPCLLGFVVGICFLFVCLSGLDIYIYISSSYIFIYYLVCSNNPLVQLTHTTYYYFSSFLPFILFPLPIYYDVVSSSSLSSIKRECERER